jgi:hypothetical protein
MTTTNTTKRAINAEFRGEVDGVVGIYDGNAYLHRYTVSNRYDGAGEPTVFEVTNEKHTVGAMLYYYYISYVGALEDVKKESAQLAEYAQRSIERIEKYGADTQLWVLTQCIDRITKHQNEAVEYLQKCYIYVDIITGQVRA